MIRSLARSERRTLGLIFRERLATQLRIADHLDVTQQSASRIVAGLIKDDIIVAGDRINAGQRGYRSASFRLNPSYSASVGISIAPATVSVALCDFSGTVVAHEARQSTSVDVCDTLAWVKKTVEKLGQAIGISHDKLLGAGVAISGSLDSEDEFNTPPALEAWAGLNIGAMVQDALDLTVYAENDGTASALAESIFGIGQRFPSFAYVFVGAGVGGGLVLDRHIWRGAHGNAGEFAGGLQPAIDPFPNLELLRIELARSKKPFDTIADMLASLDPDWPAVYDWIIKVRHSLSVIASNTGGILDIDAVVLGGLMPPALARRLIPHIKFFDQMRRSKARPTPVILPAEVVNDPACHGAALLSLRASFS